MKASKSLNKRSVLGYSKSLSFREVQIRIRKQLVELVTELGEGEFELGWVEALVGLFGYGTEVLVI